jgi:probable F420-dependent oxidoreductase
VGVHPTATDLSMPVLELAREAEARGLDSLYLPEHTHVPVDSLQITESWLMSERYQRTLDPYIASAFIAATTKLEVGTAISLVAQHDAIALAKAIATLDHLAEGGVVIGVGFGYNRQEAENHGVDFRQRAAVVEETVRLMRRLWTDDEASFDGQFRSLTASWAWPKPRISGGPPVLLGGRATDRTFDRICSWADGWIPMGLTPRSPNLETDLAELRRRWQKAGRQTELQVCCFFHGATADEMAADIDRAADLGIQRVQVMLEDGRPTDVLPVLDALQTAVERVGR